MIVVGDVHGKWTEYATLLKRLNWNKPNITWQIGDLGVGFPNSPVLTLPKNSFFFRGNHDAPSAARAHPQYLGDYGYREVDGHRIFFVGGAWSIDQAYRREDVSWWREEELSIPEFIDAHEKYVASKPEIMITHDGPNQATNAILNRYALFPGENSVIKTRTGQALTSMFEEYQPKVWIFGHWHTSWQNEINGTLFICLNELEWLDLEELPALKKG